MNDTNTFKTMIIAGYFFTQVDKMYENVQNRIGTKYTMVVLSL